MNRQLNPFLAHLGAPPAAHVYWHRRLPAVWWHGRDSGQYRIDLTEDAVRRWCLPRDPGALFVEWSTLLSGEQFIVEHTSVNPVHPLHVGSMRGSAVGASLAALIRAAGGDVSVAYFVNDRGVQVRMLERILPICHMDRIPGDLRWDVAIGVLYAAANMMSANRIEDLRDIDRLHPWLRSVVDTSTALPPSGVAAEPTVTDRMVAAAEADLALFGARIDMFEYERDLDIDPWAVVLPLGDDHDLVRVNGTSCLRTPAGLVPVIRRDGTGLYFLRDVVNTRRRDPNALKINVIGDEQSLLQTALRRVCGERTEHVAVGGVKRDGKRFSARRNRLWTIDDMRRENGGERVRQVAFALLLRRRTAPIDIAELDTTGPLATIRRAQNEARHQHSGSFARQTWRLASGILKTPDVLQHALGQRTPHISARHLVELSSAYISCARADAVPGWLDRWFQHTHARLVDIHGLDQYQHHRTGERRCA